MGAPFAIMWRHPPHHTLKGISKLRAAGERHVSTRRSSARGHGEGLLALRVAARTLHHPTRDRCMRRDATQRLQASEAHRMTRMPWSSFLARFPRLPGGAPANLFRLPLSGVQSGG